MIYLYLPTLLNYHTLVRNMKNKIRIQLYTSK